MHHLVKWICYGWLGWSRQMTYLVLHRGSGQLGQALVEEWSVMIDIFNL